MMTAVNPVIRHVYNFEERVWPEARRREIGLVAMKVLGGMYKSEAEPAYKPKAKGGRITGAEVQPAFRYALGLPGVTTAVLGCYNLNEPGLQTEHQLQHAADREEGCQQDGNADRPADRIDDDWPRSASAAGRSPVRMRSMKAAIWSSCVPAAASRRLSLA